MEHFLPHRGSALMLISATSDGTGTVDAVARIDPSHPLVTRAGAPAFLGIEAGAQAAAALEAGSPDGDDSSRAREGRLVRIREAAFLSPVLPIGSPLTVRAVLRGAAPPVAQYGIEVYAEDRLLVRAEITTYRSSADHDAA